MALAVAERFGAARLHLCGPWKVWLPGLTQIRWSRYNNTYLEPEVNKEVYRKPVEKMSEEEKAQWELRKLRPIKAAPSNISSSVFQDPRLRKFTSMIMMGGNKPLAQSLMHWTLETIKRKQLQKYHEAKDEEKEGIELNPYKIFNQGLKNCEPVIGIMRVVKAGKAYQVPAPMSDRRKEFLAMKWMMTECRENRDKRMLFPAKLSHELIQAFYNEGPVIKKKHDLHKMAEANRAFAHYRWM
ncbi:hypothetical protein JRQ81_002173 [Phrynocephalus forsythii]|uniref:Small ribosomal subunit protein uS7m n=1 Tax=Phrynocephalus forsythii TaxID=171643 RepID=A0A9Q0XI48_9SAUR|nr:hypothetical protein JRQ81_002173 [Phrynocephalus forsythii]